MTDALAFRADPNKLHFEPLPLERDLLRIRTRVRALAGMQKEALIQYGANGAVWRLVCDEGPWLNGTDLAPFPLAFFAAGAAASLMSEFLGESRDRNIRVDALHLVQDNFFTMEGSALRGTMAAGIQPTQVRISARGAGSTDEFLNIAEVALRERSPVERCLRQVLPSGFVVRSNNEELLWPDKAAGIVAKLSDPAETFASVHPLSTAGTMLIEKCAAIAKTQGPAVGLAAEQKRVVHVRAEGCIQEDGLKSIIVQCIQPAGSRFEFLSDNSEAMGGKERAPSGLAYLSAGVAFCFMTQIGRYAQIAKQQLHGYRIVQDTSFRLAQECEPDAFGIETLVCLDTDEPQEKSIQLVKMAEQTCYIHAAYRTATATKIVA